ncbi:hypothetical protein HHK36_012565 [Tetracentron sinense]|uniref:Retrovirus-related Pol polyprotein from transposon TNT 1-94 n=1 Tax=Tetracentron sinense TaxID=13715 RepID=A0A834Z507_TETSI|nr:hypothetical protein HHK36_012565 [Tetracentron sinense]
MEKGMEFEKLNESNWPIWKIMMEDYLVGKELDQPLRGKKAQPVGMEDWEWDILDRKCLAAIRPCISPSILFDVCQCKIAEELWQSLEQSYEQPSGANKMHAMKRLFLLKMKEGTTIRKHVSEFNSIAAQLRSLKINLDEKVLCLLLLSSLPPSWDILVTTVTNTVGNKFKLQDVVASLLNEETRKASTQMSTESNQALSAGQRGSFGVPSSMASVTLRNSNLKGMLSFSSPTHVVDDLLRFSTPFRNHCVKMRESRMLDRGGDRWPHLRERHVDYETAKQHDAHVDCLCPRQRTSLRPYEMS